MEVDVASEFRYRDPILDEHTLVIVIGQSGETADTLAALRESKERAQGSFGIKRGWKFHCKGKPRQCHVYLGRT